MFITFRLMGSNVRGSKGEQRKALSLWQKKTKSKRFFLLLNKRTTFLLKTPTADKKIKIKKNNESCKENRHRKALHAQRKRFSKTKTRNDLHKIRSLNILCLKKTYMFYVFLSMFLSVFASLCVWNTNSNYLTCLNFQRV